MTTDSSAAVHVADRVSHVTREEKRNKCWNSNNIVAKLTIDAASAGVAAGLVAPIVTMIDKYAFPLRALRHA